MEGRGFLLRNSPMSKQPDFQSREFTCPHCKEEGEQVWFNLYAEQLNNPAGVPLRIEGKMLDMLKANPQFPPDVKEQKVAYWNRVNSGDVFLDRWAPVQSDMIVAGLELSACRSCLGVMVWSGGQPVYPQK